MNKRVALVAHAYPVVAAGLATIVADIGYKVVFASDPAAVRAALHAAPEVAFVDRAFRIEVATNGATRLVSLGDADADGAINLKAPLAAIAATITAMLAVPVPPGGRKTPALTQRERDVAQLVAAGQRNRAIAANLGISEGTVKMHLHNVYAKLGLESRTQLAMSTRAVTPA